MNILEIIIKIIKSELFYVPVVSIILGVFSYNFVKSALNKMMMRRTKDAYDAKKRKTIVDLSSNIVKYLIIVIVGIIILDVYGIDTKSIIAGLGVFSAVLGLALQDTIKDFLGGMTIILENYYVVGDYVTYNGFTGEVIELGLKSTKIKNFNGEVLIIANRNVAEIINLSQSKACVFLDLNVAYEEDVDKVEKVIDEMIPDLELIEHVVKKSVKYIGVSELADSSVVYKIQLNCTQDYQWQVKRDALRLVKKVFDKKNIKIPYPQVEVHHD